ncbi:MAG: 30S ribosome-binding factor RbfA [Nevskiales bacterium]|nr:30S ribosome-binding factor RbfA [Nevskiales bacterium]
MPKEYPRRLRLNAQLQRELTELIRDELRDPRLSGGVTVLAVDVTSDMRHATALISLLALDGKPQDAVLALNHAAGKLRHGLKQRLKLRHIPELHFRADTTAVTAEHVTRLIREARRADRQHAAERGEPDV